MSRREVVMMHICMDSKWHLCMWNCKTIKYIRYIHHNMYRRPCILSSAIAGLGSWIYWCSHGWLHWSSVIQIATSYISVLGKNRWQRVDFISTKSHQQTNKVYIMWKIPNFVVSIIHAYNFVSFREETHHDTGVAASEQQHGPYLVTMLLLPKGRAMRSTTPRWC